MIIESGFWNYYMSFRISDNKKMFRSIVRKNYEDSVIGVALEGKILCNNELEKDYFEKRETLMRPIIERRQREAWDETVEQQLYYRNELPEFYYDFVKKEDVWLDELKCIFNGELAEIGQCNRSVIGMTREMHKESWAVLSLMPLKIEIRPFEFEYCPVHMYLFENGHAVIKTSIRIKEMDSQFFTTYPMYCWFGNVKVWEAAIQLGGRKEYKICQSHSENQEISLISNILQRYVYRLFSDNLLDGKRFSCFETLVIARMQGKQIWEIPVKGSIQEKAELYHLANPEGFMEVITSERWDRFWSDSFQYFGGFDWIKGHNCRLIISTDIDSLMKRFHRFDVVDEASYLNISIQRSFDFMLIIALCQKDGEIYLSRVSEESVHDIEKHIARYNQNRNFFETFLDAMPYNGRLFYYMISEINNDSFVDVGVRIERLKQIDAYQRNLFVEKRALLVEFVALIGTILFGLPSLKETLYILKNAILPEGDLIWGDVTQMLAIIIWGILILLISVYLIRAYWHYRERVR